MAVGETWVLIVTWLQENAPVTASLLLPAADGDVDGLPADAAAWFSIQGGARRDPRAAMLMEFVPLSLAESQVAMYADALEVMLGEVPGSLDLIPIADLLAGPLLVIDNRPGPDRGSIKQLEWEDATSLDTPVWPDLDTLLRDVLLVLELGGPSRFSGFTPSVRAGAVVWGPPVLRYHDEFDDVFHEDVHDNDVIPPFDDALVTAPDSALARMRCCICGGDDMDHAVDYLEMTLRSDYSTAEQRFGAHAACLSTVLAPGFRVEIID